MLPNASKALSLIKAEFISQGYEPANRTLYDCRLVEELIRVAINNHLITEVVDNINTSVCHNHFGLTETNQQ
jgi:hypothetical protein